MTDPIVDILVHEQYDITQGWDDAAKQIRQQIEAENNEFWAEVIIGAEKEAARLAVRRCIDAVSKAMDSPDLLGMTATIYKGKIVMVEESDLVGKHVKRSDAKKVAIKALEAQK